MSYHNLLKMAEIKRGEGLPRADVSCERLAEMGEGEGLPRGPAAAFDISSQSNNPDFSGSNSSMFPQDPRSVSISGPDRYIYDKRQAEQPSETPPHWQHLYT